jgi:hypothetical protein
VVDIDSCQLLQELAYWIRNNWRPITTTAEQKAVSVKVNPINLVWELHRPAVEERLKTMLGIGNIDWENRRVFEIRTTACKDVLEGMNPQDRAAFDATLNARRQQGNPVNVQIA